MEKKYLLVEWIKEEYWNLYAVNRDEFGILIASVGTEEAKQVIEKRLKIITIDERIN